MRLRSPSCRFRHERREDGGGADESSDGIELRPLQPGDAVRCDAIMRSLPDHFGIEEGIAACAAAVRTGPGLVATVQGEVVGFLTIARPFPTTAEITWMAVDAAHRRRGIGHRLIARLRADLARDGVELLVVLTVAASDPADTDRVYESTRRFYRQVGFVPAYELPDIWPGNIAVLLVSTLHPARAAYCDFVNPCPDAAPDADQGRPACGTALVGGERRKRRG